MDVVAEKIRDIIAIELQVERERVQPESSLRAELGMDSIAALNILFGVQEAFGIDEIDVGEIAGVTTVGEVQSLVRRHIPAGRA